MAAADLERVVRRVRAVAGRVGGRAAAKLRARRRARRDRPEQPIPTGGDGYQTEPPTARD